MSVAAEFRDRLEDLLIQRACFGLDQSEQAELDRLASDPRAGETDSFENAIAALDVAWARENLRAEEHEPMPDSLRMAILASSDAGFASLPPALPVRGWSAREKMFGLATAASLAIALFSLYSWQFRPPGPETPASLSEHLAALKEAANDEVDVEWTVASEELAAGVTGRVVWSDQQQQGFMLFRGLARNRPDREQYQLWIFDSGRSDEHPVDGGVFDIGADGEVIVPIKAKLNVASAKMFAITIEAPGGVVVSDRSRLPLLATVQR